VPIDDVLIKKAEFGNEVSLIERYKPPQELPPPKLNLKMRKSDIRIVDSIATQAKTTRLQILNDLVEAVLLRMLHEMRTKDRHCAYLLARVADMKSGHDQGQRSGWQAHLFDDDEYHNYYWNQEWDSADDNNEFSKEYRELFARLVKPER
jgi:hypothetical protein